TYAVSIFQMLEAPIDKYYATLILGILQIVGSGACVILVHYTGKRPLTFFSTAAAGVCCILVAGYDGYFKTHDVLNKTSSEIHNATIGVNSNSFLPPLFLFTRVSYESTKEYNGDRAAASSVLLLPYTAIVNPFAQGGDYRRGL
ncbi:jg26302, partial [Pararge aegeria aegeria]